MRKHDVMRIQGAAALLLAIAIGGCDRAGADADAAEKLQVSKAGQIAALSGAPAEGKRARMRYGKSVAVSTPSDPQPISAGQTVRGSLSTSDPDYGDGSYFDAYAYEGRAGEQVSIALSSSAFDAYLEVYYIAGDEAVLVAVSDDDGGGTNARAELTLPEDGTYMIVANSYGPGETGDYQIQVQSSGVQGGGTGGDAGGEGVPVVLRAGTSQGQLSASDATLDDGAHFDEWVYQGREGERVTVSVSSTEFDTYLIVLLGANGEFEFLEENDDADGTNSQVMLTLPQSGPYTVIVTSYGAGETGAYQLSLQAQPARNFAEMYPGGGDPNGKYALLIGISDYPGQDSDLGGVPVNDARVMRDVLINSYGFRPENVVLITDSEADRDHLANAFLRHLGQAGPNGTAVFYYSGHGLDIEENAGLQAPIDPEPEDGSDESIYIWGYGDRASIVLDDELGFLADQLRAGNTLMIIDACFSGSGIRGSGQAKEVRLEELQRRPLLPGTFLTNKSAPASGGSAASGSDTRLGAMEILSQPQRQVLLAASSHDEVGYIATGWPDRGDVSVFTYYLAQEMERADSTATFEQVMQRVRQQTQRYTRDTYGDEQTPQVEGARSGDRVFRFLQRR